MEILPQPGNLMTSCFIHLQRIYGRFASPQILTDGEKKLVTVPMENNCLHDETVILVLSALTWLYTVLKLCFIIRSVRFFFSFFFFFSSNLSLASLGDLFTRM